jgi:hypothetical protein
MLGALFANLFGYLLRLLDPLKRKYIKTDPVYMTEAEGIDQYGQVFVVIKGMVKPVHRTGYLFQKWYVREDVSKIIGLCPKCGCIFATFGLGNFCGGNICSKSS